MKTQTIQLDVVFPDTYKETDKNASKRLCELINDGYEIYDKSVVSGVNFGIIIYILTKKD